MHSFIFSHEEEEKSSPSKTVNHRLMKIEQKLDYMLSREDVKVSLKDFPRFSKNSESILKKVLDESIWRRSHMLSTESGYTINDIIQPGLDNPDHPIGVVAVSKDSYYTFDEVLINTAKLFHNRNIRSSKYEKENYGLVKNLIGNMEELLNSAIYELEIASNRNVENHIFTSKISRSDRRELARVILNAIKTKENDIFDEAGKFLSLDNESLINAKDQNQFFRSCGFYRDWPDGRFFYVNNNQTLNILVNEEDHIKLMQKFQPNSFNNKYLLNYFDLLDSLTTQLSFSYDDYLGYLTSLPSNLGSSTYFNVKIKVPSKNKEKLYENFKSNGDLNTKLIPSDIESEFSIIEISNNSSFFNFSQFLIDLLNNKELLK